MYDFAQDARPASMPHTAEAVPALRIAPAAPRESRLLSGEVRILAADDDAAALSVLTRILSRAGFHDVRTTLDGDRVPELFAEHAPDLVILDLHLGPVEATDIIGRLRPHISRDSYLPILVVSGDLTEDARISALAAGAADFIRKPYAPAEVLLRVRNHLHTRTLHLSLERQNQELERKVRECTRELEETTWEVLERLARAAELRDDDTGMHTRREGMGLPAADVEMIRRTAPLHDLGKVGIPDDVLHKPCGLSNEERELMQRHTRIGAEIAQFRCMLNAAAVVATCAAAAWVGVPI